MLSKITNLLFPTICIGCEREGDYLCKTCKKDIQAHPELCPLCHRNSPSGSVCFGCKDQLPGVDNISIAFIYEKLIKKLILDLKFHHRYQTGNYLGHKIALLIQSDPLFDPDTTLITHVPSHRRRRTIEKGYNQSKILATAVAEQLTLPHLQLLTKTRHTTSQVKLSRTKRKSNLTGAYRYHHKDTIPKHIQTIIIIDDIVTTGATINELGKTLKHHYPKLTIKGVVVGRHMG